MKYIYLCQWNIRQEYMTAGHSVKLAHTAAATATWQHVVVRKSDILSCVQDLKMFRRRRWRYLILDEAHMIKNWQSQRWQALLNFSARHRLLLTGVVPTQSCFIDC